MAVDGNVLLVLATLVGFGSLSSIVTQWTEKRVSWIGCVSLAIAVGLAVYVHTETPGGLTWRDVPEAFIEVAALILN